MNVRLFVPGVVKEEDERESSGVLLVRLTTDLLKELPTGGVKLMLYDTPFDAEGSLNVIF